MTVARDASTLQGGKINSDGAALVQATVEPELAHASEDGDAYSFRSVTQALNAGETGLFVKNLDTKPLHFETLWLSVDADTVVQVHFPTTEVASPDGVAATEINLNTGEPSDGDRADARTDETTNAIGDIFWSGEIMAASNPFPVNMLGAPRLIKNRSIAVDVVGATTAHDFVLFGHYAK